MADPKDKAPDESPKGDSKKDDKKIEDERRRKSDEGHVNVDLPPAGGAIPSPLGPPSRETDEEVTP